MFWMSKPNKLSMSATDVLSLNGPAPCWLCVTLQWFSVTWSLHQIQPGDWTLPTSVWVSGDDVLQNHPRSDVWAPVWECTMPPSLLRMSLGCVTCGCHGDAFENAGRAEMNVLEVGAKAGWLWGWHSPAQWKCPFSSSWVAVGLFLHTETHLLDLSKYVQINGLLTCQYTSLTGHIIYCYGEA